MADDQLGTRQMVGLRHVAADLGLFALYSVAFGLVDWLGVRRTVPGGLAREILNAIGPLVLLSTFPTAIIVNWWLTYSPGRPLRRAMVGLLLGLFAIGLLSVPFFYLLFRFHFMIGGTL